MDTRRNLIITKRGFIARDVVSCQYVPATEKWHVKFKSGSEIDYRRNNLIWLKNPVPVDFEGTQVKAAGRYITNIREIYAFKNGDKEYWHIIQENGWEQSYRRSDIELEKSILTDDKAKKLVDYFLDIARVVGLKTEDGKEILVDKLKAVEFLGENTAAAVYLGATAYTPETGLDASCPIFPFGCNESQLQAVKNALSNRISIIEGPPGTGKTQTILNIIANLVLQEKTVQIVSNNNSAILNVQEKLESEKYGFGFITALLGNSDNKKAFAENQSGVYPDLSSWHLSEKDETFENILSDVQKRSGKLQEIFKDKNKLAGLKQKLDAVELERQHFTPRYPDLRGVFFRKPVSLSVLSKVRNVYTDFHELNQKPGLLFRILNRFFYGVSMGKMMKENAAAVTECLDLLYYELTIEKLQKDILRLEQKLKDIDAEKEIKEFTDLSLKVFRARLEKRYASKEKRPVFGNATIWYSTDDFLSEYPVVLSTNYCARSNTYGPFDYVIMDEASQADLATGMLALSSARNAVIVGDTKQLPNVVSKKDEVQKISDTYKIDDVYDYNKYCFLKSVSVLLGDMVPTVTLREHYRCHPQIIGFCNQKFYNNDLIVMTENTDTEPLKLVQTVPGNHARENWNQRQIDVITEEVLPMVKCNPADAGIIAPYNDQVNKINKAVKDRFNGSGYEAATIHKFQGREMDTIIFSTTDDVVRPFSDGAELLNVAISRAQNHLVIVASDKEQPSGSNMADLIGYIKYHNPDVLKSKIHSVFDLLYKGYEIERRAYLEKSAFVSRYESENLMYTLIKEELGKRKEEPLDVLVHHPLVYLISDRSGLTEEENRFIDTGLSHIDFLIFNTITKQPVLAVEVDGISYHKDGTRQAERDKLKDHILEMNNIPYIRFQTNGSGEAEQFAELLNNQIHSFIAS